MILHITILLCFQLAGEVLSRALGTPVPGPVLGMAMLVGALLVFPRLAETIRSTAQGLLAHLSLLFVPAGVGIVGHLDKLGANAGPIIIAIIGSTVLAIVAGVLTFVGVSRLVGAKDV